MTNLNFKPLLSRWRWLLAVAAALALAPQTARAETGSVIVTGGGEVKYTDAAKVEKITNPDGTEEFLLYYTYENSPTGSFELPGTTSARILAIGGGGGGGGSYGSGFNNNYGGGAGGGAGGFFETNGIFTVGIYSVAVGAGGKGAANSTSSTKEYIGTAGDPTSIYLETEGDFITAFGGGGGGGLSAGASGGSGGGGSQNKNAVHGAAGGVSDEAKAAGNIGNAGGEGDVALWGAGGGGAGKAGAAASAGGAGGEGKQSDITLPTGTAQANWPWYAGGGAGSHADKKETSTTAEAPQGGKGGGGNGGAGTKVAPTAGEPGTGGGGGGSQATLVGKASAGGSGIVIVRIAGAISGGLERPTDLVYKYDGKEKKSYETSPFYTVTGDNVGTNAGVYVCTVTLKDGFEWVGGGKEPVKVSMTIYDGQYSGTVDVTGAPVSFQGAAETNWVKNANGGYDFLLKFTGAGTYTLPGSTMARVLAVGGGGGGGGSYGSGFNNNYGGGAGGGAGGFVETNALISGGTYAVAVGAGGKGAVNSTSSTKAYVGGSGGNSFIFVGGQDFITAYGGGGGGGLSAGANGGSGGGGSQDKNANPGAAGKGTVGQGHDGGAGDVALWGGGGGGAGKAGDAASAGGAGGDGKQSDITLNYGIAKENWPWYAGGGAGSHADKKETSPTAEAPQGGKGGGGNGGAGTKVAPTAGEPGTGGGGGGSQATLVGKAAAGGSGIVYVRISAAMVGELVKPEKKIEIVYDGNAHTTRVSNVFYKVTGENIATNARDTAYVSTVTLKDGYTWPGGDKESPIDIEMTIKKCPVEISGLTMDSWSFIKDKSKMPDPQFTVTPEWVRPRLHVEYATSKEAPDDKWDKKKPTDVGDYWVRVRIPDTENYSGGTAYASFKITKVKVTLSDLFQKDWMVGTPDEATPKPRCTADPDWVQPKFEYGAVGSDPEDDTLWSRTKPTELGEWAIRARAEDKDNYDYTPITNTFHIVKGLGNVFTDYVEFEIPALEDGRELTNFPYKVILHETDDAPLAGFLYERAGADGKEMGATDPSGNVTPYTVMDWKTHGDSVIYVKIPLIASSNQTIRLYWRLRPGATAPGDDPKGTWSDWTKDDVEKTDVPAATFDLVVKDGFRVDYWVKKPVLSETVWPLKGTPGVLTEGILADGTYTKVLINTVTGAPATFPPKQAGAYRFVFTLDNPDMEYEDLSYHIDFAVTDSDSLAMDRLQGSAPSLTASGRVFLANDDDAPGHEVSGQSYWRTNSEEQAYYWTHTGTHDISTVLPNLVRFPGTMHRLNFIDETGTTNLLWRLENVVLGNSFRNADYTTEKLKCFLPWSSTALGITSDDPKLTNQKDESGWLCLRNTTDAHVYSPCYTNGIGTIYFDAVNIATYDGAVDSYGIEIDYATNVWEDVLHQDSSKSLPPTDENCYGADETGTVREFGRLNENCWHPATMIPLKRDNNQPNFTRKEATAHLALDIAKGGSISNFYRVCVNLDYRGPVRFRIRRAGLYDGGKVIDQVSSFIALDNIIVSHPKSAAFLRPRGVYDDSKLGKRVVGQEAAMSVPYPSLTDHSVYGFATNVAWVSEVAEVPPESLVTLSRLHYRWRYGDQAVGAWRKVDLSPFDDFKGTVPLDLTYEPGTVEQGDVEFFYESFMRVPFYRYYDYSGANVGLDGLYTEETGTLTNTYADVAQSYARYTGSGSSTNWFFRLRAGQSDWDEISVVLNDGTREWREPMELIGDHTWRGLALVTNTTGDVSFKFSGNARRAAWGGAIVESGTRWDSPVDVDKMPYRGAAAVVTSGTKEPPVFHADTASNYIEFQFDDETGGFTIGHAEYQSFNSWHDAWREDKLFVGHSAATSGVSDAQMITTNAHMRTWPLPKLSQDSWNESFILGNYTDPAYPKYTSKYFLSHKMPHLWTGENGMFVDASLTASNATDKSKNSGIAWQMRGAGAGNVSFTQNDTPSGIDTITFKARLAQTTKLSDFSAWKGGFAEQNYTFVFPALLSAKNGADSSPGATMSIVGYYDPWYGCYEFRIERTDNEGLLFSIYKWAPVDGEITASCLGSHWFKGATFLYDETGNTPSVYGMFISVGQETKGETSIVAGLSTGKDKANVEFSAVPYRVIACVDKDNPLTSGTFGAICANCSGLFLAPRHYTAYLPKTNLTQWKHDPGAPTTCYGYIDSENVTYTGTKVNDKELLDPSKNVWGFTPGRADFVSVNYGNANVQYGIRQPTDLKQTIGVYLKAARGGSWELYKEETVAQYGFKDYTVKVRTNENCHVMLQAGAKQSDVTVWQITQTGWNGENIPNLDSTANDFVYTSAFVTDEVNGKVTNRYTRLQPTRASPANALSIRSPLLNGLGMIKFWYKDLDPNTEVWVQVATNLVESALPGSDGYNLSTNCVDWGQATKTDRDWITVRKYGYDELVKSDLQTYYLGLHFDVNDPQRGAFRIVVPPSKVREAQAHVKEDGAGTKVAPWGAITITDIQVQDEPAIDTHSWIGWNMRTLGDATDSEKRMFISDMPGAGLSGGLNNSYEKDIAGDPSQYDKNDPYVQSPTFGTYKTESATYKAAIGRVRFRARLYDTNASPAKVSVYGVVNGTATDWGEPLATFEVTSSRYVAFEYPTPSEMNYAAIRLVVDGVKEKKSGVNRVLLEEIVVSEKSDTAVGFYYARPFRSGIAGDLVIEDILAREQQPLTEESWGVQTKLKFDKFGNEVDYERGFRVTLSYFAGDKPWGYENWVKEASAVKEVELAQVGAKDDYVFRSTSFNRASIVPPQRTSNAVVQFVVRVYYWEKGGDREMSRTISVSEVEGDGWTNPDWYYPLDYNRVGNVTGAEWKPSVSPYTLIDSISPGRAWINEVNYNDGMPSENGNVKVVSNQFIEIAVPWGVDMTDWSVRLTDFNHKSIDLAVLGRGGIPGVKKSGKRSGDYDFLVLQSPTTRDKGGIRDPEDPGQSVADGTWSGGYLPSTFLNGELQPDMPYQIELIRPSGVVEHQFVVAGTNDYRSPIYYPSFGYKYDGTNLVNELNAIDEAAGIPIRRFYAGEDVGLIAPGVKTHVSFGVAGGAHGEEGGWSGYQRYTPGRKNESQDELTGWFIRPSGESCWVYARVEGGHLSQRIGKDTEPDTFVIVNAKGSTNIEYTVANWYQVDKVLRIENGVTNETIVGKEGSYVYTVDNVTGTTYIVAKEGLSQRVIDAGLDPADRYTPAIMRWLEKGLANGRPFANPDGEIRNATFLGLWSTATNIALNLKSMYVLDLDPTEGGWWLRGGWSVAPEPVNRLWYYGDGQTSAYTNFLFGVRLYLSNGVERAGVTRPEVYAPPRLQGPNGERSDDLASYTSWTGVTFKIEGYLPNGMEGNKGFQPFRWYVFGADSFDSDCMAKIEVLDPFQPPSIGVSYGWPVYKGIFPWWRFNLSEKMQPVGVEMLNKDSTYEGKPPFVKP